MLIIKIILKKLIRLVKIILSVTRKFFYLILDSAVLFEKKNKKNTDIVIVRVDAIGDFILWIPSAQKIKELYFDRKIILICSQVVGELARSTDLFDEILEINLKKFVFNPFYRLKIIQKVRRLNAVLTLHPTYSRVFITGDSLVRATMATERIGFISDLSNMYNWERWVSNRWYTKLVKSDLTLMMELERNAEFLKKLNIKFTEISVAKLKNSVEISKFKIHGNYFIIFPGASSHKRIWSSEKFAAVAKLVKQIYGWEMIICGTTNESSLARSVINFSGLFDSLNLVGQTTLPEFIEIVRNARLLIGNETSAVHIAAAVGTPSICLLGGGHFGRFVPYSDKVIGTKPIPVFNMMDCFGCNWQCIKQDNPYHPVPCIENIKLESVFEAIKLALIDYNSSN